MRRVDGGADGRVDGLHLGGADAGHDASVGCPAASARAWRSCGRSTSRPTSSSSTSRRWASRSRRPRSSSASSTASGAPASRRSSSTTTSSTSTRSRTGSWSWTVAAWPASSRPRAIRSRSSWASCARSPRRAPTRKPSATACRRRRQRAGRRSGVSARRQRPRRRAGNGVGTAPRPVGVADRHHGRVPAALARVHRPRAEDVPRHADLPVVRPDDAVLRDHRDGPDDGHRRRRHRPLVPVDHGARAWSASSLVWQATGSVALGVVAALGVGVLCGLFNGLCRHVHRHPVAGRDDRDAVPLPRPRPGARRRHGSTRSSDTQDSPAYERDGRQARSASRWSSTGSSSPRSRPGCCSTGIASARTPTSSATTPRRLR